LIVSIIFLGMCIRSWLKVSAFCTKFSHVILIVYHAATEYDMYSVWARYILLPNENQILLPRSCDFSRNCNCCCYEQVVLQSSLVYVY